MSPSPPPRRNSQRLQKLLAAAGVASRRRAEELLRAGRVAVNGETAQLGQSADPVRDVVSVDGVPVAPEPLAYWLVHKPRGVVTTVHDPEGRSTVLDLVPEPERGVRLFPVGRLDRDTEGLVLLTNDGALAHVLLHPSHETEREYRVTVKGRVGAGALRRLAQGIELEDGITAPARVGRPRHDSAGGTSRFTLTLVEGRKRQIRRALDALDHPVLRLLRVRMGPLRLGRLARGAARPLTAPERRALLRLRDAPPAARPGPPPGAAPESDPPAADGSRASASRRNAAAPEVSPRCGARSCNDPILLGESPQGCTSC